MSVSQQVQRAIYGKDIDVSPAGTWQVIVSQPGSAPSNITRFRGIPVTIQDFSFADPFGPKEMSLVLEQVSIFDRLGEGDLTWCRKHADLTVEWDGDVPSIYPFGSTSSGSTVPAFRWEGYIASFSRSSDGLTIQCKGAMYQLDNHLAKPEYLIRPLPYEWAIARQFREKPALRLHQPRIIWPSWWPNQYDPTPYKARYRMTPIAVSRGDNWTGLLTRSTGNWDPVLTSYIQSLLVSMYTERGRWTLDLDAHRQPVMLHRDFIQTPTAATVVIDPVDPGVKIGSLDEDWEQTLTDVYGQGTSLDGVTYSGMQVSADGQRTYYQPLAAKRQTYPSDETNQWYEPGSMPKEVMVQMQDGLDADDAATVARAHLSRFSEPGQTGTLTLESDPVLGNGEVINRHLVRAGMDIQIPWVLGRPEGIIGHITESRSSLKDDSVSLTFDTKQRDALTTEEVRLRGRDALTVSRMLIAGQYQPIVPDQLYPWSYAKGSGYLPSPSLRLFRDMPNRTPFPWEDWTTQRPPKNGKWRDCYIHIKPARDNATLNWHGEKSSWGSNMGVPMRMAQAGTIRLVQIAAYDRDGHVLQVPFHVSFYYVGSVNAKSMPTIPAFQASQFPPYKAGQHFPFARDGFETFNRNGTKTNPNITQPVESVGLVRAWGTYYDKAGYWPGSYTTGDSPTGMLVDESQWSFDISAVGDAVFDPYSIERNLTNRHSGHLYAMIYCDAQGTQDVYFLGRVFRVEPGTGGTNG